MNLISFSIKTKGTSTFFRRLQTVFTRFGFTERTTRQALLTILKTLEAYNTAPTFFIPAVVLKRHARLISEVADQGAEIGIHGRVHNDYRTLQVRQQQEQTQQAIEIFTQHKLSYAGFRNPYLGWTEESLEVFRKLGLTYESNEAVLHKVVELDQFPQTFQDGFEKSLALFQAIPCTSYTLRPHFEDALLRIPTSIPDDEMLFDRLRMTNVEQVGQHWCKIMQRIYECEGLYTLNLHPERALLCQAALQKLLAYACGQSPGVWLARLQEIASWWHERSTFRLEFTPAGEYRWIVRADCTPRATLLARHIKVEDQEPEILSNREKVIAHKTCVIQASCRPCVALSPHTPTSVKDFLHEQGYPVVVAALTDDLTTYACYFDLPQGLGQERREQIRLRSELLQKLETLDIPLIRFAHWPAGKRAALAISGDIDSVTIQDFLFRILEVR